VQNWVQQYHAYWGTDEESLENYVAAFERDETATGTPNTEEQG
jgi:hypothetical protein